MSKGWLTEQEMSDWAWIDWLGRDIRLKWIDLLCRYWLTEQGWLTELVKIILMMDWLIMEAMLDYAWIDLLSRDWLIKKAILNMDCFDWSWILTEMDQLTYHGFDWLSKTLLIDQGWLTEQGQTDSAEIDWLITELLTDHG